MSFLGKMSSFVMLRLNTSNMNKFQEFQRMFGKYDINLDVTHKDIKEIVADPLSVAIHKASQLGDYVIVEDTSLDIEGEQVGINVKWMMNSLSNFVGKRALWNVYLAILIEGKVHIYRGQISGTIVQPRGDSNFGFDPVFQPEGRTKTLAEEKPDEVSARAQAVEAFVKDIPFAIVNPIYEWNGAYQE